MFFARRIALLRFVALIGLVASAALTADSFHPGRAFCPLEAACNKAKDSPLGEIAGIPTSVLGILAFTGLFVLSLLPPAWARKLLRPAGVLAAVSGQGFILYQAFALGSFCPLCVVADGAAMVAAIVILTWPPIPMRLSGRGVSGDSSRRRAAWVLALMAAVFVPFGWPRSATPAWVEITPLTDTDLEIASASEPEPPVAPVAEAPARPSSLADIDPVGALVVSTVSGKLPPPTATGLSIYPEDARLSPAPYRPRSVRAPRADLAPPAPPTHRPTPPKRPRPEPAAPKPAPRHTAPLVAPRPPATEPRAQVRIVEYLNAYCAHCRATHRRLDRVIDASDVHVKRRRVYTWASNDYPMWARACAYAGTVGLEDRMFEELMKASSQAPDQVYAAAKRAGLNLDELRQAVRVLTPPSRLVHDKKLQRAAGLRGLPTLDIGRRRLMGEQTETELSAAIRAALAPASS